jgi:hypothetical protein
MVVRFEKLLGLLLRGAEALFAADGGSSAGPKTC